MPTFQCPRCGGTESFVRTESVLRAGRTNVVNTTKIHNVEVSSNVCKKCGEKMQTILTDFDKKLEAIRDLQTERTYWLFAYIVCCGLALYSLIFSLYISKIILIAIATIIYLIKLFINYILLL
jgi:Flp pilus assembly protein TadB